MTREVAAACVTTVLLALNACSGPMEVGSDPKPEPDASTEPSDQTSNPEVTSNTPVDVTSDEPAPEPDETYTCGDVNAVPYEGRLLTRTQYQNTVADLFSTLAPSSWVANFPAENEVGGFRTNAESHRATPWLAEAHLTAAEAIATQVRANLSAIAPCATAANLSAPSSDPTLTSQALTCARDYLATYGLRAFRRPLTVSEEQPFLALFESAYQEAGAPYALELLTQALLLSPQFLYRFEAPKAVAEAAVDGELVDSFGLASRLSYLLWNSMPDQELFALAQTGSLEQPEVLRGQAERMLESPKALSAVADFAEQWLGLAALNGAVRRVPTAPTDTTPQPDTTSDGTSDSTSTAPVATNADSPASATVPNGSTSGATSSDSASSDSTSDSTLGLAAPDTTSGTTDTSAPPAATTDTSSGVPTVAPTMAPTSEPAPGMAEAPADATNQYSAAWRSSIIAYITDMYANDASFAELMSSPKVFVDSELAALYGHEVPEGTAEGDLTGVDFPAGERAGLLTQPGLMAMLAHSDQSAPILRGVFVLDALLCQPPAPAPATVDTTPPMLDPNATTRERFAQHTVDPSCASCHVYIDPIGLGLENYDELGRFRDQENGLPVDASGQLFGLRDTPSNGAFDGAVGLATRLSTSAQAQGCFVTKWYAYGSGRPEKPRDLCTINDLRASFAASGGNLRELLVALVMSDAFRYRTLETVPSTVSEGEP